MRKGHSLIALGLSFFTTFAHSQSALTTWLNENSMSPVPVFYQDDLSPALMIADVCCTNGHHVLQNLGISEKGKSLVVRQGTSQVIQSTLTVEHDKTFMVKVLKYDPSLTLKNGSKLEVSATSMTIVKLLPLTPEGKPQLDDVIYRDAATAGLLDGWVGKKGVFTYMIEGVAYATSFEATESSSQQIIGGLGVTPPKCTDPEAKTKVGDDPKKPDADAPKAEGGAKPTPADGAAAPKPDPKADKNKIPETKTAKAGDLLSSITNFFGGAAVAVCTNESGHAVLNAKTPTAIGIKVVKVYTEKKDAKRTTGLDYTASELPL